MPLKIGDLVKSSGGTLTPILPGDKPLGRITKIDRGYASVERANGSGRYVGKFLIDKDHEIHTDDISGNMITAEHVDNIINSTTHTVVSPSIVPATPAAPVPQEIKPEDISVPIGKKRFRQMDFLD